MRMKKLLTLLLTAVIGCLPMWAAAGTDTYFHQYSNKITYSGINIAKGVTNGNLPDSNTGAVYYTQKVSVASWYARMFFWDSNYPMDAVKVLQPAKDAKGNDCIIESVSIKPYDNTFAQTFTLYVATNAEFTDPVELGTLNNSTRSINVTEKGNYSYFKLVANNGNGQGNAANSVENVSFTWVENAPKVCDTPTVSANYWVPGGTVTLTAPTEGSTLTYSWGVDAEADVATATGTTVENAASPATITIPADAEVGKTFWVRATAKLDGYTDS